MNPGPATTVPNGLPQLLTSGETWLMERVITYARYYGYAVDACPLAEPWRVSVARISEAIVGALARDPASLREFPADARITEDPLGAFILEEARVHRRRGVTLSLFWGLFKYYRRTYLEFLDARLAQGPDRDGAKAVVGACFERMEYAMAVDWAAPSTAAAEQALAQENRRLANEKNKYLTVFESIPHALFLIDAEDRVENANPDAVALVGASALPGGWYYGEADPVAAASGRAVLPRSLPEALPWLSPVLAREVADWDVVDEEVTDDVQRRFAVSIHPLRDVSGKFSGRVVLCRDVTAARLAEESLRQSEERYRTLVDLMHQGLVIYSPEGRIDFANDTMGELVGLPPGQVVGCNGAQFVRAEDRELFAASLRDRRTGGCDPYELALRRADGRLTFIMSSPTPLIGQDGEYQGSLEVLTDVSRLKELEMRLVTAKRLEAIGQLAGGVAHEINTPLQYVTGNLEFALTNLPRLSALVERYEAALDLIKDCPSVDCAKAEIAAYRQEYDMEMVLAELPLALAESHAGAERVAAFVRSIKRFAQAEAEGKRHIDVAEAVMASVEMAKSAMHDVAAFSVDLEDDLPPLPCVPGDFNQVLLCLLLNAAQAVEEAYAGSAVQGSVHVRCRVVDGALEVSISDTGRGIPTEIQDKIFNPFFTTKEVGQGTGQGLPIALSIVQRHQGSIRFETQPGRGTTFYVTFPLK